MFKDDKVIENLLLSIAFCSFMNNLTERKMIYAQGLGFELKKNESKGFPWHIGTQSFGYQRAKDFGCTIWIPLVEIDSEKQKGGMAYVPKNKVSGEFMYTHVDPAVFNLLEKKIKNKDNLDIEDFVYWRDGPLNDSAMNSILNFYAVEDSFEIGDALIFDKYVIHRSVMLG